MTTRQHTYRDRVYAVMARFEGADAGAKAREFCRTHANAAVLDVSDGEVIVTDPRDPGFLPEVDSGFETTGWTNILSLRTKQE